MLTHFAIEFISASRSSWKKWLINIKVPLLLGRIVFRGHCGFFLGLLGSSLCGRGWLFLLWVQTPFYVAPAHPSPTSCAGHFVPGPSSCCEERTVCILSQQLPKEADLFLVGNSTQVKAKLKEAWKITVWRRAALMRGLFSAANCTSNFFIWQDLVASGVGPCLVKFKIQSLGARDVT